MMHKKKIITSVSVRMLLGILLFLISLSVFIVLAHEVVLEKEDWFDSKSFVFFRTHSSPFVIRVFKFLTFFGSTVFLFPAWLLLIGALFFKRKKANALDIGLLAISSTLLMYGFKAFFARTRPDMPLFEQLTNYSFPSGHALSSFIFCSALAWLLWQTRMSTQWKWVLTFFLLLFSFSIGISRIVLRYHYASDVVGGFSIGIAYMLLFLWLRRLIRKKNP